MRSSDPWDKKSIDEDICLACTHWDSCYRTFTNCEEFMGFAFAALSWVEDEDDESKFDVGC